MEGADTCYLVLTAVAVAGGAVCGQHVLDPGGGRVHSQQHLGGLQQEMHR